MKLSRYFVLFTYTFYKFLSILLATLLNYLLHPSKLFQKREIYTSPPFLQDNTYGEHKFISANSIKLHCVISGPENAPVMLMLHGFPEFWYSWRYQIVEFKRDYRVIAVDLRGYGDSDKPTKKSEYTIDKCVQDLIELLGALNCTKCTVLGHDWGGAFAWKLAIRRPDLVDKLVVMCSPHPGRYNELANSEYDTLLRQWYAVLFGLPWIPELVLSRDNFAPFRKVFRSPKTGLSNQNRFTDEDMQAFLYTFSQTGAFTPPLNYYRKVLDGTMLKDSTWYDLLKVPTLILLGENDPYFSPRLGAGNEKYLKYWESQVLNCSHWMQQDCPEEVNQLIREFCVKKFE